MTTRPRSSIPNKRRRDGTATARGERVRNAIAVLCGGEAEAKFVAELSQIGAGITRPQALDPVTRPGCRLPSAADFGLTLRWPGELKIESEVCFGHSNIQDVLTA